MESSSTSSRRGRTPSRGFTLLELLSVIAIIAVLIALLVPLIETAKRRAYDSLCMAKEKRCANAYQCYSSDHGDMVISTSYICGWDLYSASVWYGPNRLATIYDMLFPYLSSNPDPNFMATDMQDYWLDPASGAIPAQNQDKTWWHYGYPVWCVYDRAYWTATCRINRTTYYPVRMVEMPSPSTTGLFMCHLPLNNRTGNEFYIGELDVHFNGHYDPWPMHSGISTVRGVAGSGCQTNVSRLDGSVRAYPWRDLVEPGSYWELNGADYAADFPNYSYARTWTIARQYLWSGKICDGWIPE